MSIGDDNWASAQQQVCLMDGNPQCMVKAALEQGFDRCWGHDPHRQFGVQVCYATLGPTTKKRAHAGGVLIMLAPHP